MIVVDTSVLIDLLRGKIKSEEIERHGKLATCFPIECELYKGTRMARNTEEGEKQVEKLLERLERLETNHLTSKKFADLKYDYQEISELDLMITAICQSHEAEILTRDEDFKTIDGLEVKTVSAE